MKTFTEMRFNQSYEMLSSIAGRMLCIIALAVPCQAQPGAPKSPAAKTAFEKGDYAGCIKESSALISREPNNDAAYGERAQCHLLKAETDARSGGSAAPENALALGDAEKAISLNSNNSVAYFVRGSLRINAKDADGAIADLTRVIAAAPKNLAAYLARARAKHLKGVKHKTILTEDLNKIFLADPKYPNLFATVVDFCLEDGENPGYCAEYFLTPLESDPSDRQAKTGFIRVTSKAVNEGGYNYDGRRQEAVKYLLQVMAEKQPEAGSYLLLGDLYNGLKDYPQAEANYSQAVRLSAKDAVVFARRGDFYRQRGEYDQAIADYTQAITIKPGVAEFYRGRGLAYANKDDSVKSLADYNKALALDSQNALAWMHRGNLYYAVKDYANAVADLNRAITLKAADPCVNLYRGRAFLEKGDLRAAYSDFEINPIKCGMTDFYRGEYYFKQADYGSAIHHYKRALNDYDYRELDKTPVFAALERAEKLEEERRIKNTVNTPPPPTEAIKTVADNFAEQPAGTINQTAAQWIESFKERANRSGLAIIDEGFAGTLPPYKKSASNRLSFEAVNKDFVLLVFTDDPTYDSFVFIDGEIVTNPLTATGYYVSAPKITNLSNKEYISAVSIGSGSIARTVSVEFRADKPGEIRYLLFTRPSEAERSKLIASDNRLKPLLALADSQYNQKNYAEAVKSYSECLRLKPDSAPCFQFRGFAYYNLKKYEEAISDFSKALQIEPNNALSYATRADSYARLQRHDAAIADYSKAIELDPQNGGTYGNRGYSYLQLKKYTEAVSDYSKSIRIKPDSTSYYNRGLSYALLEKNDESIADYSKSIELDAGRTDAYYQRGKILNRLKRYAEAVAGYTKVIELAPQDADAYFERGYSYQFLKKYDEAIADYTKAIQLKPDDAYAYGNRGAIYYEIKKDEQAIADMTKAIELNPKYINFYQNRVIVYCNLGRIALAQADERKIIGMGGKVTDACR